MRPLAAFALCAILIACSGDDDSPSKPSGEKKLVFVAEATPAGAALTLRARELSESRLVLEVVGHATQPVYGLALRLSYEPTALGFVGFQAGQAWSSLLSTVALGNAKSAGTVVAAVTARGPSPGVTGNEVVLGVVTFDLKTKTASPIAFVVDRSGLVDTSGQPIAAVQFAGGALVLQ